MIQDDYVNFAQAKKLKEKGFPQDCDNYYDNDGDSLIWYESSFGDAINWLDYIAKPTLYQVQKWLREREEKNIWIDIITDVKDVENDNFESVYFHRIIFGKNNNIIGNLDISNVYNTYQEALLAGIDKALTLI